MRSPLPFPRLAGSAVVLVVVLSALSARVAAPAGGLGLAPVKVSEPGGHLQRDAAAAGTALQVVAKGAP